jgi:predicted esterase
MRCLAPLLVSLFALAASVVASNAQEATNTIATADANAVSAAPAAKPVISSKDYEAALVYVFDPCVFGAPQFPGGSFSDDALVRGLLGPVQVQTTFYNARFQPVTTAEQPGRYGAVVRVTLGDGTKLTRYVTLYRSTRKLFWRTARLNLSMKLPPEWGVDPAMAGSQKADIDRMLKWMVDEDSSKSSQLAVLLAGLSEMKPGREAHLERTDCEARDAAWWFKLKTLVGLPNTYPYLVSLPDGYDAQSGRRWPLILFLHGSGERGDSLVDVSVNGLPKLIAQGRKFPAIVISPQCPDNNRWQSPDLSQLLDDVSAKYRVDPDRICVTGLSMGGFGAWALALVEPDRFAALAPICGGGDPLDAARLRKLPIWAFHGGKDDTVPNQLSIGMVRAVRAAGGHAHLTIFPNDGHDSWDDAYNTEALYTWLLAQKRGQPEVITPGVPTRLPVEISGGGSR